ncbi:hypothetical protein [Paramaledivibacter caminithermalis]|jgi:hypothetical protein|uniref:Uncharacterized protein n=1 Tax=Paramaledivibacter caminithermalis (strain DSM 15212 / CIP 107654 / DViRD3) TaxID=1121301 RepID=A0A1M6U5A3_PARC5|nr:hypothetical protein [Paramaledivibacter caminithermalis]SHK64339.1 hypothetical protein SAMN02745912_03874 [Paramaledivibacter caminithermalis DSM 15212]
MKKIISFLIIFCLIFTTTNSVLANSYSHSELDFKNTNGYDIFTLNFDNAKVIRSSQVSDNYDQLKTSINYIKKLNLEEKGLIGLEEKLIDDIKKDVENEANLESIVFYIPKIQQKNMLFNRRGSTEVDYGSYDGFKMKAAYTIKRKRWSPIEESRENIIKKWKEGLVNIGIGFTTAKIWVPLSLFQLAGTDISSFENSAVYYYLHGNQTDRYILIQDKNKKASSNASAYIPILHDQKFVVELDSMVAFPGLGNYEMKETIGPVEINSKNFSNKSKTRRTAYKQYITSDNLQIFEDLIGYPDAIFSYK